uniref:Uncharacterized protein n=1 Tax=Lepeophtheirus salmonis TaxID=72036 RepID=A0A0K2THW4_LEPSM
MFGVKIAWHKSNSRSIRQFRDLLLISIMFENSDTHRYVDGNATSIVKACNVRICKKPFIVAPNVFRLFSAKIALAAETCTKSKNWS